MDSEKGSVWQKLLARRLAETEAKLSSEMTVGQRLESFVATGPKPFPWTWQPCNTVRKSSSAGPASLALWCAEPYLCPRLPFARSACCERAQLAKTLLGEAGASLNVIGSKSNGRPVRQQDHAPGTDRVPQTSASSKTLALAQPCHRTATSTRTSATRRDHASRSVHGPVQPRPAHHPCRQGCLRKPLQGRSVHSSR